MVNNRGITLILGGARSGKSDYGEKLAAKYGETVLYIATAEAGDAEMAERIAVHRRSRPAHWATLEAPRQVGPALDDLADTPDVLLLDCLTLLVSNIVLAFEAHPQAQVEAEIEAELVHLIQARARRGLPLIIISNEVGLGLVPTYPLGRLYRDALGRANQYLAAVADTVILMVAGLPMVVKGEVPI